MVLPGLRASELRLGGIVLDVRSPPGDVIEL
jgi:hypothetical protein